MKLLQRLFKVVQEEQAVNPSVSNKKENSSHGKPKKEKEIIASNNQKAHKRSRKRERIDLDCKDLNKHLASLLRRENLRACFSNTLYIYSVKIKKEDVVRGLARNGHSKPGYADQPASSSPVSTHHVGNKVLPVSDTSTTSSTRRHMQNENGGKSKGDNKTKAMSKMKELLRWSAAAKSQTGGKHTGLKVSHFKARESVKGLPSDDAEFITESPKISFQLSAISATPVTCLVNAGGSDQCHCCTREGNWITTDDEFVVLEL